MVKHTLKQKAVALRKKGFSYNLILEKIPVSKSTLSLWLRDVPYRPNSVVQKRVNRGLLLSAKTRSDLKLKQIAEERGQAVSDVGTLNKRDLFILGIGLYWGRERNLMRT